MTTLKPVDHSRPLTRRECNAFNRNADAWLIARGQSVLDWHTHKLDIRRGPRRQELDDLDAYIQSLTEAYPI